MAMLIKGITVILHDKRQIGTDSMNMPVYEEVPVEVENVLFTPAESTEVLERIDLKGRKLVYQLGIPKGDWHEWEDRRVTIEGKDYHTIGPVSKGIEDLIPLDWNKKIKAESYE